MVKSISENALKNNKAETIGSGATGSPKARSKPRAIILIGFMGAGKSSVGRTLAQQLGWKFADLDQRIEQREGRKVPEIFRDSGEASFRQAEQSALQELLQSLSHGSETVIALGGGAFAQESISALIEAANVPTVFLDAAVEELWTRCNSQSESQAVERPLLSTREAFQNLYEVRRPHYLKATLRHHTDGKSIAQITAELLQLLALG